MARFTDSDGETWEVQVTGATIKALLGDPLRIDLGKPDEGEPPLITRYDLDIAFKVDVLYEVLREQCDAREINGLEFARRLKGNSLADANEAFLSEWRDFFLPLRPDLAAVIEKAREFAAELMETRRAKMESPEYDRSKDQAIAAYSSALDAKLESAGEEMTEALRQPGT